MNFADVTANPIGITLAVATGYGKRDTRLGDSYGMTRAILLDHEPWTPTKGWAARTVGRRGNTRRTHAAVAVDHGRMGWSPAVVPVADVQGTWEEHEAMIPVRQADRDAAIARDTAARADRVYREAVLIEALGEVLGREVRVWEARGGRLDGLYGNDVAELVGLALAAKRAGLTPAPVGTEVTA